MQKRQLIEPDLWKPKGLPLGKIFPKSEISDEKPLFGKRKDCSFVFLLAHDFDRQFTSKVHIWVFDQVSVKFLKPLGMTAPHS